MEEKLQITVKKVSSGETVFETTGESVVVSAAHRENENVKVEFRSFEGEDLSVFFSLLEAIFSSLDKVEKEVSGRFLKDLKLKKA